MFYYVNGTVAEIETGLAVIDCSGVGYACATTNYTLSQLKKGERAKLYTYLNVREDAMEMFGFASQSELRSFKMLIGVSGVGPKAALSILSSTTPQQLSMAVVMGDEKALTAAPGIGKKIAQRIILELKDKCYRELSGGQQQRVLLARALCAAGDLLVLDEPVTGLDPAAADDLYRTLRYLNRTEGMAVVMVTHDIRSALRDAAAILHAGRDQWFLGTPGEYLASPYGKRFGGDLS